VQKARPHGRAFFVNPTMDDDLDALIRRVDPDRWLSSRFVADPATRADVIAIYAFDHELARAPRVTSQSMLGEIRLAWWREALDEIFEARAVRAHPTAQALARAVARHSLPRESLEMMLDARYRELDPAPMIDAERAVWADETGGAVSHVCAMILGAPDPTLAKAAGALWALSKVDPQLAAGRRISAGLAARGLPAGAFPAVAHAVFATSRARSEVARRARLIWAVAIGRL